jgi:hypothetical protein
VGGWVGEGGGHRGVGCCVRNGNLSLFMCGFACVHVGSLPPLPAQKFSSNVVEKCLQMASDDLRDALVRELCSDKGIELMLQDQYGASASSTALAAQRGVGTPILPRCP